VLPIVVNGRTSLHTLTQSFYVTKFVEAVKTVPAENYEFIATQVGTRVARWHIMKTKNPIRVNLGGSCNGSCWYI
jgi:hypothetical protein